MVIEHYAQWVLNIEITMIITSRCFAYVSILQRQQIKVFIALSFMCNILQKTFISLPPVASQRRYLDGSLSI